MNGRFIYHLSYLFVLLFTLKNYQVFPETMADVITYSYD